MAPPDVKIKIFQTITIYPKLIEFIISVNKSTMKKYPLIYHSVLQTSTKDVAQVYARINYVKTPLGWYYQQNWILRKKKSKKVCFGPSSSQCWGWHGSGNFRRMVFTMIRVHIIEPPTDAPAAILRTTGRMRASTGDRSTKIVSDTYSPENEHVFVGKCAISRQIPKSTASNIETTAFPPEENNSTALLNTPE